MFFKRLMASLFGRICPNCGRVMKKEDSFSGITLENETILRQGKGDEKRETWFPVCPICLKNRNSLDPEKIARNIGGENYQEIKNAVIDFKTKRLYTSASIC